MENPIPFDWDGESWRRFCVCWPDSPQWLGLLRGFLTYCTRGRSWDGKTGTITEAQAIGWQIANANLPLEEVVVSCQDAQWIAKAILLHAAVTGGFAIDPFPTEITDSFFNVVDFRSLGLANRLGPEGPESGDNTIQATIARLEDMVAGVQDTNNNVAKALIFLTMAVSGQSIENIAALDLDEFFASSWEFTTDGLANRIGPQGNHSASTTLSARMDQMREAIEELSINLNVEEGTIELPGGEELANIVTKLEEISTTIETRSIAETTAQNTNFDDLVAAVEALTLQCETIVNTTNLTQNINCGGSGTAGAGTWEADPSGQTTTPTDQAGPPPSGFDSWAEFKQYQCDTAYLILNDMIHDLSAAALLAGGYAAVATLVPLLIEVSITPIGWVAWLAIAGLVIYCFSQGIEVSLLSQLLIDNKEEFVCELLAGTSVPTSISNFSNLVDSKVDSDSILSLVPEIARQRVKDLINSYASINSINRLYVKTPLPPPTGNDCSECEADPGPYTVVEGAETSSHPSNPILGTFIYPGEGYNCVLNARIYQIAFHLPVTITSLIHEGENFTYCGGIGSSMFRYYSDEAGTVEIASTNSYPQDTEAIPGVRYLNVVGSSTEEFPTFEVQYTVD